MEVKLVHRLHQTADRLSAFETGVENELRKRLLLLGSAGIVSVDGGDIDNDEAPCAVSINSQDATAINVGSGTVVFANGEYVDIEVDAISANAIDITITDGQVVRLEYGEVAAGDPEGNPYSGYAAPPKVRKKTAPEMLVVETTTAFNAQPSSVVNNSIVLGVVRVVDGVLTTDNGRDSYSFSRPWFSPIDTEHRSQVGTGLSTPTNPHATSLSDLTVGQYTAWQALVGSPSCVLARPVSFGRIPGILCEETIPSGSFALDSTGLVTGVPGSLYAPLGFWPDRLMGCFVASSGNEVSAWIPKGRNVIAISDPTEFAAAVNVDVYYTKVQAGALPGSLAGLTSLTVSDPTSDEIIVAGGNFYTELTEGTVSFADVGLVPMKFDILVDSTGRVYKNPDCLFCNTRLETLGSTAQPFTIQPRAPSRLRVAISNYNAGYTEVRLLVSGTDTTGAAISEVVVFTGPGPVPQTSFSEVAAQRLFTANVFASVGQLQVQVRNGDGANTTVTVFAEASPEQPELQDDLLLASVQWTGSEVNALYSNDALVALDRRLVTRGGGSRGQSPIVSSVDTAMIVDSVLASSLPSGTVSWATIAEDFSDPHYMLYPQADFGVQGSTRPVELAGNSHGIRHGYTSRKFPLGSVMQASLDATWLRLLPRSMSGFPARFSGLDVTLNLYRSGAVDSFAGTLGTNPYPPYQVAFAGVVGGSYYAASVSIAGMEDYAEAFQGFIFHIRS